jgi:polyadenylate-binding protein
MNDKNNGTGFVSFSNHEEAQKAIDGLHLKKNLGDQSLIVAPHVYKKENELSGSGGNSQIAKNLNDVFKSNIFVKFIPNNVTKEEFTTKFSKAGKIASAKLEEHRQTVNGESFSNYQKGYVLYENVQDAQKAIQFFHNSNEFGYKRPIEVDFWKSKDDMKKQNDERSINDILQLINIQK